jgi:hypothetical protein
MNTREKQLAIGFGGTILLLFGVPMAYSTVFGPISQRSEQVTQLTEAVSAKQDEALAIARARKQLKDWQAISLPPDRGAKTSKRPDALDAQRLYQAWLTDLAHLSGLTDIEVKPGAQRRLVKSGRGAQSANVFISVPVTIDGEARYAPLAAFLDHFHRTDLLHRLSKFKVTSRESDGDPLLKFSLEAEGLALLDVPWRRTLFPEATLSQPVADDATTITVQSAEPFPKKTPFRVRIGAEFLTVTAAKANTWTVTRAVERTHAAKHVSGESVELCPIKAAVKSLDKDGFREVLASNVFIKPVPPKEYKLQLDRIAEQVVIRGQKLSYAIPAKGHDPTAGEPEFRLLTPGPAGLELDRGTGRLSWSPAADQSVGTFPLKFEVVHPNAPDGKLSGEVTIVFREPNTSPTVVPVVTQTIYRGQPWSLKLAATDVETAKEKLQLKLGDNPPEGVSLDPATKELKWTPAPTFNLGDYTVNVVITDDGTPPQSTTVPITVKVEDDFASYTFLTAVVYEDDVPTAWLYDRSQDKNTKLRMGGEFQIADVKAKVLEFGKDYIIVQRGDQQLRLELGMNLRQMISTTASKPAAPDSQKL